MVLWKLLYLTLLVLIRGAKHDEAGHNDLESQTSAKQSSDFYFADIHPSNSRIWGSGLSPDKIVLPCRYFFIQLVDGGGEDVTSSEETPEVTIEGVSEKSGGGRPCRAWTQVLNRQDGSYIVRYKVHWTCYHVVISVKVKGEHVGVSPVRVGGAVHAHTCDCPDRTLADWIEEVGCPAPAKQMEDDLARWAGGVDMKEGLEKARVMYGNPGAHAWCHYAVVDNKIHRQCYGQHVGFSMFWDAALGWLVRRARVPDIEMMVNLGDWPLVRRGERIPMFSWCGSEETTDILLPTYELTEASLECMGRQSLDVLAVMGRNSVPWEKKEEAVFWRGRDSRRERLKLVEMSKKFPKLINASITAYFFFRDEEEKLGKGQLVSFFDFFNYKYQLNVDGTVAAYRFPFLLAGSSLVFKQESKYSEHFYSELEPWVHYVPVAADLSDLVEKIEWAKENDDKAKEIAKNGRRFAEERLMPLGVMCYHAQLLQRWAGLLKNPVVVAEGMEEVEKEKEDGRFSPCECEMGDVSEEKKKNKKDEL